MFYYQNMNLFPIFPKNSEFVNLVSDEIDRHEVSSSGEFIIKNIQSIDYSTKEDFDYKIKNVFENSYRPIFIMKDHPLSLDILRNFSRLKPNIGIVIFDAHPDCNPIFNYDFFGKQKDLLISLIEERIIDQKNIILVGLRKWTKGEYLFLKNFKIKYFDMKKIDEIGIQELKEVLMENLRNFSYFYLSIDLDVIDPSYAPGVNSPEPNGITLRELLYLLDGLKRLKNLTAADISEYNNSKDTDNITIKLLSKILVELG